MKRSNVPSSRSFQTSDTSLTLLERVCAGEDASWEKFVHMYGPLVYSWCRRAGLSPEDAGDISQDVFTTLSQKLAQFERRRPGDSFRRWLKTITNNRARDFHRWQRDRPKAKGGTSAQLYMVDLPTEVTDELCDESDDERAEELSHLLKQATELVREDFEPNTWQAFWQTVVQSRATADVAADLQLSVNAVRIAKSRVRARLRSEMAGLLNDPLSESGE
ncbi:RNA polymerase sigma factor [Aporhodopirellula aestuarii]|uniref:RNA polymerase sigma factor n=1 Tax=Aporhodopirellula aestuarii TaxID=2950107 RepID=A0ABT0U8N8_9BACT|nr:sigma-70 family RNA polymerase sigma factor [Aporhodopirellula aestuarii]MCM2372773.1 RNA polymerase sigma factor [Aporhodopirellula aestuarii]